MAKSKKQTNPRKLPVQARSRFMVESIVEATARVLLDRGYEQLTTNSVAEVAGVSIGSLYEYFPSKEALVAAALAREGEREFDAMVHAADAAGEAPLGEVLCAVLEAFVTEHAKRTELKARLLAQAAEVERMGFVRDMDGKAIAWVQGWLKSRGSELRVKDYETAAFVVVRSVEATVHAATAGRLETLNDGRLLAELTELVLGYLLDEERKSEG